MDVTSYLLGKKAGGGSGSNLQTKSVSITENGTTTVNPDSGYDGMSRVDVTVSGILDTSDANATASDMPLGKSGYVNGVKVNGDVPIGSSAVATNYASNNVSTYLDELKVDTTQGNRNQFFYTGDKISVLAPLSDVAPVVGATAGKIKKNEVICGVTGTYEGSGGDVSEYFNTTVDTSTSDSSTYGWNKYVKKLPDDITYTGTKLASFFRNFEGTNFDLSSFNVTSSITDISYMFYNCINLSVNDLKPIENWNTSGVTNCKYMFQNCGNNSSTSNISLDLSGWRCKSYADFLNGASSLTRKLSSLNLSGIVTSETTSLANMFYTLQAVDLDVINMSNWDTSSVTTMNGMFALPTSNYASLELDLSDWVTTSLTNTSSMFSGRAGLTKIDMRKFTFANVTSYNNMFRNVPNDCLIIVKDDAEKTWITGKFTNLTNVKTVAEYEA